MCRIHHSMWMKCKNQFINTNKWRPKRQEDSLPYYTRRPTTKSHKRHMKKEGDHGLVSGLNPVIDSIREIVETNQDLACNMRCQNRLHLRASKNNTLQNLKQGWLAHKDMRNKVSIYFTKENNLEELRLLCKSQCMKFLYTMIEDKLPHHNNERITNHNHNNRATWWNKIEIMLLLDLKSVSLREFTISLLEQEEVQISKSTPIKATMLIRILRLMNLSVCSRLNLMDRMWRRSKSMKTTIQEWLFKDSASSSTLVTTPREDFLIKSWSRLL